MIRAYISIAVLLCSPLFARAQKCSRSELQSTTNSYIEAQKAGDPNLMHLAPYVKYTENLQNITFDQGIVNSPLPIAFYRSFYDVDECISYTEAIVNDQEPYVLGMRLKTTNNRISEINGIVARKTDWNLDTDSWLTYSSKEDWQILPQESRISRQKLIDAANAYLDMFSLQNIRVPFGVPCARLRNGDYTGDGLRSTCKEGIPVDPVEIVDRSYIVDVNMGTVNIFCRHGKSKASSRFGETPGLPTSHLIRLVNGKIRYIHWVSIMEYAITLK